MVSIHFLHLPFPTASKTAPPLRILRCRGTYLFVPQRTLATTPLLNSLAARLNAGAFRCAKNLLNVTFLFYLWHLFKVVKIEETGQMPNDKKLFERSEFFLSVVGHSVDFLDFQKESWSTEFIEVWFFAIKGKEHKEIIIIISSKINIFSTNWS